MLHPFRRSFAIPFLVIPCALFLLALAGRSVEAITSRAAGNVICQPDLRAELRQQFAAHLREITGWSDLRFDERGVLRFGGQPRGGSASARQLLSEAVAGKNIVVLEDASDRADVVFCRVVPGEWKRAEGARPPAYVVLIDFSDFSYVSGDKAARAAFNTGWAVLHEIAHVVHDLPDGAQRSDLGECEILINRMRRECGLAERAEYFYNLYPGTGDSPFMTRIVRLAFVQDSPAESKKRRYWLIWDARLVGGGATARSNAGQSARSFER